MPDRKSEYDPDELPLIEPDEDPEYEPEDLPAAPTTLVRSGSHGNGVGERDFEYRTEVLTVAQVADGKTLVEKLTAAAAEGWSLLQVVDAGEKRVLLLRRQKKSERERRSVGFAPPGRG
jgi:hypothetical protein